MYHSSVQLSGPPSPISTLVITAFSLASFILSSISSLDSDTKDQLSAGSTPSRVSGDITPTPTVAFQPKPGFIFSGLFIVASLVIGSAAGTWLRSPAVERQGRLNREPSPTPPPLGEADLENGTQDDGAAGDGDGGDDDPQDNGVADNVDGVVDGVGSTAAAPAPEDPPPPPGGIGEDDEDGDLNIGDDLIFWFLLLLLVNVLFTLFNHGIRGNGSRAKSVKLWNLPTAEG
ncbi:hypothetical protein B0H16DRAFT_1522552, partial [Mycena metata]